MGAALLDLLGELQDSGPVLLVLDDAHWADSASLHALVFCLRRLRADRVLAVISVRSEEAARLPVALVRLVGGETGAEVVLSGLAAGELVELSAELGSGRLSMRTAARFARHTEGNPLLAGALLEEMSAKGVSQPDGGGLPAPRSFALIVLARLGTCSAAGQELVAAASVLGGRWPLGLATRLAELAEGGPGDPLEAIDEAVRAGLITVEDAATGPIGGFTHPLVRAAVYREISLTHRAELHRPAAQLAEDPRDALRHRIEAAPGADAELATAAAELADRDAAAGSWGAAARGYLWAARVAPSRPDRERRLLDAVVALLFADDLAEAGALLEGTSEFEDTAQLRGYRAYTKGDLGRASSDLLRAWELCERTTDRVRPASPGMPERAGRSP